MRNPKHAKMIIADIVADMIDGGEDMGLITIPSIILVIGVNGVGKTTTIGKLAAMYKKEGKKVILGAADTFRAAAIEQLEVLPLPAAAETRRLPPRSYTALLCSSVS